ncbi:MAG TPA: hypothetical protein VG028_06315 [Terriglobia bacterium]|nr:hypothetical protein [Terriglobia bacterium]
MRRSLALSGAFLLILCVTTRAKVKSNKSMYVGGTATSIAQGTQGRIDTDNDKVMTFEYKGGKLSIPYDRINSLEYGQKAGRRVGLAIAITPLALLSKKRKHFLTIGFQDENDKQQATVFELGKNTVRVTISTLEARSGRKVEYQDEEARKSGMGN